VRGSVRVRVRGRGTLRERGSVRERVSAREGEEVIYFLFIAEGFLLRNVSF
jgi:hypothetical protein